MSGTFEFEGYSRTGKTHEAIGALTVLAYWSLKHLVKASRSKVDHDAKDYSLYDEYVATMTAVLATIEEMPEALDRVKDLDNVYPWVENAYL